MDCLIELSLTQKPLQAHTNAFAGVFKFIRSSGGVEKWTNLSLDALQFADYDVGGYINKFLGVEFMKKSIVKMCMILALSASAIFSSMVMVQAACDDVICEYEIGIMPVDLPPIKYN